jgi:hypothetical protein
MNGRCADAADRDGMGRSVVDVLAGLRVTVAA